MRAAGTRIPTLQDDPGILWERQRVLRFAGQRSQRVGVDAHFWRRIIAGLACFLAAGLLAMSGCSPRWNTLYNANQAFKRAEEAREQAIKGGLDVQRAVAGQRQNYLLAIEKAQKALDLFPGHSASDEALFLQGKSHHRLASYRMSIRQFDLLFTNFPLSRFMEESLFLQAINYMMINDAARSQDMLNALGRQFPESRFQADVLQTSGDNAFALQNWERAIQSYKRYLETFPKGEDWDNSSLQLAEALWELDRCEEATGVLQRVVDESSLADRVFRARLLLTRCYIRLGELDAARSMVSTLKNEAEIHGQQGMVGIVEAEIVLAGGQLAQAVALLESMEEGHLTREVKPIWANMLGHAYLTFEGLQYENLEKARDHFQQAVAGVQFLEDADRTRRLLSTVRDYMAIENQLPDTPKERAGRLRLQQANALLFTLDRPRMAYEIFAEIAADSSADSTVTPRALYGAMLLLESAFDQPDSAQIYAQYLLDDYPDSPQAYKLRSGTEFNLLAFLLEKELAAQRAIFEERRSLETGPDVAWRPDMVTDSGLRRQMIYLQRRPNLIFPPPPAALRVLEQARVRAQAMIAAQDEDVDRAEDVTRELPDERPDDALLPDEALQPEDGVVDTLMTFETVSPDEPPPAHDAADSAAVEEVEPEPEPVRPRRWDF